MGEGSMTTPGPSRPKRHVPPSTAHRLATARPPKPAMAPPSNSETGSASDEKTESELALARCRVDLMFAIARFDEIDEGYDLSDLPEGWFPLLMATQLDSYTAVNDLLEEGADPIEQVTGGVHGNIEPSVWQGYVRGRCCCCYYARVLLLQTKAAPLLLPH